MVAWVNIGQSSLVNNVVNIHQIEAILTKNEASDWQ